MSNWKEAMLGSYIDVKHGYAFPGSGITDINNNNVLVTPGNFNIGGGFKSNKFKYFNGDFPDEYILKADDLVVTMTDLSQETDTLGYSAKIPFNKGVNYLHNQRIGLVKFISSDVNKDFIYWLMRTKEYQSFIVSSASGTSIMHTSPTRIKEYVCLIPPLPEQERIVEVLNSLENKIELLHSNSKTLEQLVQTLFTQWIIKEAKENWEEKSLEQIAEYLNGLALQKFPAEKGKPSLPAIKIREMNQGVTKATDRVSCDIPQKYIIENGDILFSWSGSLDVIIWTGGIGALNQHLFKVSSNVYPKWLIYFATRLFLPEFRDIANDKATTMGHIQRCHLSQSTLKLPDMDTINKYDRIVSVHFNKIIQNHIQIQRLETLRNTLLPKLMSGTVRVEN